MAPTVDFTATHTLYSKIRLLLALISILLTSFSTYHFVKQYQQIPFFHTHTLQLLTLFGYYIQILLHLKDGGVKLAQFIHKQGVSLLDSFTHSIFKEEEEERRLWWIDVIIGFLRFIRDVILALHFSFIKGDVNETHMLNLLAAGGGIITLSLAVEEPGFERGKIFLMVAVSYFSNTNTHLFWKIIIISVVPFVGNILRPLLYHNCSRIRSDILPLTTTNYMEQDTIWWTPQQVEFLRIMHENLLKREGPESPKPKGV